MRAIRALSAVAAAAVLALTAAACTGSSVPTSVKQEAATSSARPGASAAPTPAPTPPSAKPSPAGAVVTITPGNAASGVDPAQGIAVTAAGGTLRNVAVTTAGDPVTGTYAADRASWHSTWALNVAQSYTVTATGVSAGGVTTTKTSTFRTLTPASTFYTQVFEGYQQTYGVGMPIILTFSEPVKDKAAVERSISLRTSKPIDANKFMPWLQELVAKDGARILRSKGIVAMKGDPKRFVFQGVHMMLDGDSQREWRPDEKRESKVVFIGRDLAEEDIRNGFLACAA